MDELKRWGIIGLAALLGAGILFRSGQAIWSEWRKGRARRDLERPGSPAQVAMRLRNAIRNDNALGIGTDEEMIRRTLIDMVPHLEFWRDVIKSYKDFEGHGNLMDDLESDLSRTEWNEVQAILAQKPANGREAQNRPPGSYTQTDLLAWARRIKAASDYEAGWYWQWGTDEEAIYAVLRELPSQRAALELNETYKRTYGLSLVRQLEEELDSSERQKALNIIKSKPQ